MFDKIYELVCDNPKCGAAMNQLYGTLKQAEDHGHIVVGNKCYCDQDCYNESKEQTKL